jgi:hypothetical protein
MKKIRNLKSEILNPMPDASANPQSAIPDPQSGATGHLEIFHPQSAILNPQSAIPEINALHHAATTLADQARVLGECATRKAILLGLKLAALKDATPHGQWESLFASGMRRVGKPNASHVAHLIDFAEVTARRYIAVAANLMSQRLSGEQSAALMELAARPATNDLEPAEITFLDDVMPEKSLRRLYLNLGIVKPTIKEQRRMQFEEEMAQRPPEPPREKRQPTLAESWQLKKDAARLYWFGTRDAGMVDPGSLVMQMINEARNPAENHLLHLGKQDLIELETTLKDILKITKQLIAES